MCRVKAVLAFSTLCKIIFRYHMNLPSCFLCKFSIEDSPLSCGVKNGYSLFRQPCLLILNSFEVGAGHTRSFPAKSGRSTLVWHNPSPPLPPPPSPFFNLKVFWFKMHNSLIYVSYYLISPKLNSLTIFCIV